MNRACFILSLLLAMAAATTTRLQIRVSSERSIELIRERLCDLAYWDRENPFFIEIYASEADMIHVDDVLGSCADVVVMSKTLGKPLNLAPPAGYNTPAEIFAEFERLASSYSGIAQLIDLTEFYKAPETHNGNHMFALKISDNVSVDEDEPNILYVGNHHSRELITPQLALDAAVRFVEGYSSDNEIKQFIDNNQLYIMYTVNPDGLNYVWEVDDYWRKNRRNNGGSYGVDLNRNYPFGWDFSCGGSSTPASDTYRGPSAGSEPETQTMLMFHEERRFAKVLDVHSYAREVRVNYGSCASLPSVIDTMGQNYAKAVASLITGYTQARSCCTGGHISESYGSQGALAFLIETGTAFQPPAEQMREELLRVWPGAFYFLQLPIPVSGRILDSRTGAPIYGRMDISGINFNHQETKFSSPVHGRYHLWVPEGSWNVTVTASGYGAQSFQLRADEAGAIQDMQLA